MRVLAILVMMLLALTVEGAQWTLQTGSPSGGTFAATSSSGFFQWSTSSNTRSGSGTGSGTASGPITFVWNWTGSGSPPPVVVVYVQANAGWGGIPGTGSCADGLGDPQVLAPYGAGGNSTGAKYIPVPTAGTTLTYTINPSVTGGQTSVMQGDGIGLSVTATPQPTLPLTLQGVINVPTNEILIGQELDASVSVSNPQPKDTYTWSITGNVGPFGSYVVAPDASTGKYNAWNPGTSSSSTIVYLADPGYFCIMCLYQPTGGGQPTFYANQGRADPPTSFACQGYKVSQSIFQPNASSPTVMAAFESATGPGIVFSGNAQTPSAFINSSATYPSGTWGLAQLWTPTWKVGNLVPYIMPANTPVNGTQGCDGAFPYEIPFPAPTPPCDLTHKYEAPADGTVIDAGGVLDNPAVPPGSFWQDSPSLSSGGQTSLTDIGSWSDYMLYFPPPATSGGGTCMYVPLQNFGWALNNTASWSATTSTWTFTTNTSSYYGGGTYPKHPQWTNILLPALWAFH